MYTWKLDEIRYLLIQLINQDCRGHCASTSGDERGGLEALGGRRRCNSGKPTGLSYLVMLKLNVLSLDVFGGLWLFTIWCFWMHMVRVGPILLAFLAARAFQHLSSTTVASKPHQMCPSALSASSSSHWFFCAIAVFRSAGFSERNCPTATVVSFQW